MHENSSCELMSISSVYPLQEDGQAVRRQILALQSRVRPLLFLPIISIRLEAFFL